MDRAADLRADYDRLGKLLAAETDGSKAAAIVRERRIVGELLDRLEGSTEVSVADQLASRRRSRTAATGGSSRRRKPG
jgi:hypothetical protein